jgi:glucose-6-phosphate dehydrogenase assembly protein OpcA
MGKTKRKRSQSQSLPESITPLLAPIRAVQNLLDRFNIQGVIIGGVAASLAVAHRPKDMTDIQAIAESHADLDKARIKNWVEQFGEALDLPDIWSQISQLL